MSKSAFEKWMKKEYGDMADIIDAGYDLRKGWLAALKWALRQRGGWTNAGSEISADKIKAELKKARGK